MVETVARGGIITFDCGPAPVTITLDATAKVRNDTGPEIVLDGGGLVTLSGGGQRRIHYMNTCDEAQVFTTSHCQDQDHPRLTVQNLTFADGNATGETLEGGGGGAIFVRGGRLKVVHSRFVRNRCDETGPDLGGAAIRVLSQSQGLPVYVVDSTFGGAPGDGGVCANGGAVSSIGVSWVVLNSVMSHNSAVGHGANPARAGTPAAARRAILPTQTLHGHDRGTLVEGNHAARAGRRVLREQRPHWTPAHPTDRRCRQPSDGSETPAFRHLLPRTAIPQLSAHPRLAGGPIRRTAGVDRPHGAGVCVPAFAREGRHVAARLDATRTGGVGAASSPSPSCASPRRREASSDSLSRGSWRGALPGRSGRRRSVGVPPRAPGRDRHARPPVARPLHNRRRRRPESTELVDDRRTLVIHRAAGDLALTVPAPAIIWTEDPAFLAAGDLDGDGRTDLAIKTWPRPPEYGADTPPDVWYLVSGATPDGTHALATVGARPLPDGDDLVLEVIGDVGGDDRDDVAFSARSADPEVRVHVDAGSPMLAPGSTTPVEPSYVLPHALVNAVPLGGRDASFSVEHVGDGNRPRTGSRCGAEGTLRFTTRRSRAVGRTSRQPSRMFRWSRRRVEVAHGPFRHATGPSVGHGTLDYLCPGHRADP